MNKALFIAAMLLLSGCGTESDDGQKIVTIFINRGAVQCESSGMTPEESADILTSGGVNVISSSCGEITGAAVLAVCGAGTLRIIVHEIHKMDLQAAEDLEYAKVDTLMEMGLGYVIMDC